MELSRKGILTLFIFGTLTAVIFWMTWYRPLIQDDGWYASYSMRILEKLNFGNIKSWWDYTDANDRDFGASFIFTSIEAFVFGVFGVSFATMKAFNAIEIVILCLILFLYIKRYNFYLGLAAVIFFVGWKMFNFQFYNRPEVLSVIFSLVMLYILTDKTISQRKTFIAFALTGCILDIHPLGLLLIAGVAVTFFFKNKEFRISAVFGGLTGLVIYCIGNYLVNRNFGLFSGLIMGTPLTGGDHYLPIFQSNLEDIKNIALDRFNFLLKSTGKIGLLKHLAYLFTSLTIIYLLFKKRLVTNRFLTYSTITYFSFIILATLFSEARGNGFRLYHCIPFALLYFSMVYTIIISLKPSSKIIAAGLVIFCLFPYLSYLKDSFTQYSEYYKESKDFSKKAEKITEFLPDTGKILMRPTFSIFNYNKKLNFNYTYGLLRYMYKNNLGFKDAIIKKHYSFVQLDDVFKGEFFMDSNSVFRHSYNPYYKVLKNIGITSNEFKQLIKSGFLIPVVEIHEFYGGDNVLYKVNYN